MFSKLSATLLLVLFLGTPAFAESWGVQQGSWNSPRLPSTTNLSGAWGVKPIESVKGTLGGKATEKKEVQGAQVSAERHGTPPGRATELNR